jgi:hypothetical protein
MSWKTKLILAASVLVLTLGGIAAALWSASGSGTGRARAVTAQTITVNATTGTADLYPGFNGGDLYFTLTNPNPYNVTFTSMTAGAITSSDPTNCPTSNVTVAGATGLSLPVTGGATSGTLSIPNVVTMVAAAPNGCQGVSFDIAVTLSGTQS